MVSYAVKYKYFSRISQNKFTTILHHSLLINHSSELFPIYTNTLFLYIILVIFLTLLLNILARLLQLPLFLPVDNIHYLKTTRKDPSVFVWTGNPRVNNQFTILQQHTTYPCHGIVGTHGFIVVRLSLLFFNVLNYSVVWDLETLAAKLLHFLSDSLANSFVASTTSLTSFV